MNKSPFVLCLTNTVAANFTANVLLAIGAKPAMIEDASEASQLASLADALLVNLGTVNATQAEVMRSAVNAALGNVPWVLDPVAVHSLSYRRGVMEELLAIDAPAMIRGNCAEIDFIRHLPSVSSRLCDTTVMLATGEIDRIYVGRDSYEEIRGGVSMLQIVTATGCAQGAICAAMLGRGMSPLMAARTASRLMKSAGERAFARATTPGSFKVALVDALWELAHD